MKKRKKQTPPWPAFVDSIFAVLLIILLIVMLFLVFRVLYVVESSSDLSSERLDSIKSFIVKPPIVDEVVIDEQTVFEVSDQQVTATFKYSKSLDKLDMYQTLKTFISNNPNTSFKLLIKFSVLDKDNPRRDIYNQALALIRKIKKDYSKDKEIGIVIELQYYSGSNILLKMVAYELTPKQSR